VWCVALADAFEQLTRDDPGRNKTLSRAALGLAVYGASIFVFWYGLLFLSPACVADVVCLALDLIYTR